MTLASIQAAEPASAQVSKREQRLAGGRAVALNIVAGEQSERRAALLPAPFARLRYIADPGSGLLRMVKIVADIRVIVEEATRRILDKVAALGYGEGDDGALCSGEPVKHSLAGFRRIQMAHERSNHAIVFLIGVDREQPVEKVLLRQGLMNPLVRR